MSVDQQSHQRAMNAALLGLIVQIVLAVSVALIGLYADSPAVHAIAWQLFGGVPLWAVLWLLFNQHRLEAVESLEVEQMQRSDAAAAALFDEAGDRLNLARKRLERLYRIGLPATALLVGLYLAAIGGLLFYRHWGMWQAGVLQGEGEAIGNATPAALTTIMVLSVGLAFFGFVVARYVAGMTRKDEWIALRAGAAYLMSAAVLLLLLIAAAALAYVDYGLAFPLLALIVPGVTALLGFEMLFAFVADLYRPRLQGEIPRPAFESRLLGWMTSPDSLGKVITETIRYQFGIDFSSSWFYRLFSRALLPLILVGTLVLSAMSSFVLVAPQQAAVVTVFGEFRQSGGEIKVYGPGLHFKPPWPIGAAEKLDVYRVHKLNVGSRAQGIRGGVAILWTNEHTIGEEDFIVTAPAEFDETEDLVSLAAAQGAAGELVGADVVFFYRIKAEDLASYLTTFEDPEGMLEAIAESVTSAYFATRAVDELLSEGRIEAGEAIRQMTQEIADRKAVGLEVLEVAISAVHPPQDGEVAQTFLEQINALQTKQTTIEEARREAVATLAQVAGSRDLALRINRPIQREEALLREIERVRQAADGEADERAEAALQTLREQRRVVSAEIERLIAEAGGEAAQILSRARADRWRRAINEAAAAERFTAEVAAFREAPQYYAARRYFEAITTALQDRRKIVMGVDTPELMEIRFNLEDASGDF